MAEEYSLSYPQDRVDWIAGITLEALRKGRLQRAKEALFEEVVHVTRNGCEILSKWPVQEITVVEM